MSLANRAFVLVALLSSLSIACQQQPEATVETASGRLENPELGLALASVPHPFEAVSADASAWSFTAPGTAGSGILILSVGPQETGSINLIDVVKERQAWFESAAGGTYFGNRELGGPFGTIYTARGSYESAEGPVEETWAYAIHPGDYRLLSVQYTYPLGESGTRVEQLMGFLGEIESLTAAEETATGN